MAERPTETYFRNLSEGKFLLQRSKNSGKWVFYPRVIMPGTGEEDLEWAAPSGRATVYSTTVVHPRPPEQPYNVSVVELEEGPRMMTRVEGVAPNEVRIGMIVQAQVVRDCGGEACVVFKVAGDA